MSADQREKVPGSVFSSQDSLSPTPGTERGLPWESTAEDRAAGGDRGSQDSDGGTPEPGIEQQGLFQEWVCWFVPMLWMAGGGIAMAFSVAFIVRRDNIIGVADIVFWLAVIVMAAARTIDVLALKGETVDRRPATVVDLRCYLITMPLVALSVWFGAHALARFGWFN
jgi:hypothetical protein